MVVDGLGQAVVDVKRPAQAAPRLLALAQLQEGHRPVVVILRLEIGEVHLHVRAIHPVKGEMGLIQVVAQLPEILVTAGRVNGHRLGQEINEGLGEWPRAGAGGGADGLNGPLIAEIGLPATEHQPQADTKGEEVAAAINGVAVDELLGRGVAGGAAEAHRVLVVGLPGQPPLVLKIWTPAALDDAEVGDLDQGVLGHQDILGFQVAVDDAARVGELHAVAELNGHRQGGAGVIAAPGRKPGAEVAAIDVLDEQVRHPVDAQDVVTGGHVGVHAHPHPTVGLGQDPLAALGIGEHLGLGNLDRHRDLPSQVLGDIDLAHGAASHPLHPVAVEDDVAGPPLGLLRPGAGNGGQGLGGGRTKPAHEPVEHGPEISRSAAGWRGWRLGRQAAAPARR